MLTMIFLIHPTELTSKEIKNLQKTEETGFYSWICCIYSSSLKIIFLVVYGFVYVHHEILERIF